MSTVANGSRIMDKSTYQWVWRICSVRTNESETVPMEKGDLLYICIDGEAVSFHHRTKGSTINTGLWSKAKGTYDASCNGITGELPNGTTFSMELKQEKGYHRLTCTHKRNPEEGQWDGDDDWEPT
ncbi:MAG: hypothetical protein AAAFM81_04085 [Pseudomonadota bacterium]